jgi:hypothetical protein
LPDCQNKDKSLVRDAEKLEATTPEISEQSCDDNELTGVQCIPSAADEWPESHRHKLDRELLYVDYTDEEIRQIEPNYVKERRKRGWNLMRIVPGPFYKF